MDDRARSRVRLAFPGLVNRSWKVTSPATPRYNCVAWAAGDDQRWWWPAASYFWPQRNASGQSVEALSTLFVSMGYGLARDESLEAGFAKVAIFANEHGPTHVARQLTSGAWTSKLGSSVDIEHPLRALEGSLYGVVVQVLAIVVE